MVDKIGDSYNWWWLQLMVFFINDLHFDLTSLNLKVGLKFMAYLKWMKNEHKWINFRIEPGMKNSYLESFWQVLFFKLLKRMIHTAMIETNLVSNVSRKKQFTYIS